MRVVSAFLCPACTGEPAEAPSPATCALCEKTFVNLACMRCSGRAWVDVRDARFQCPTCDGTAQTPTGIADGPKRVLTGALVAVGLLVGGVWFLSSLNPAQPFSGTTSAFEVIDSRTLEVQFTVYNDGDEPAHGRCGIRAYDHSDFLIGWDLFETTAPVEPGASRDGVGRIRIEDEAAATVARTEISSCDEAR